MTYNSSLPLSPPPTSPLRFHRHDREDQSEQKFSSYFSAPSGLIPIRSPPSSSRGSPPLSPVDVSTNGKRQAQPACTFAPTESLIAKPMQDFFHSFEPHDHELPDRFHFARFDSSPSPESSVLLVAQPDQEQGAVLDRRSQEAMIDASVGDENFPPPAVHDVWTDQNTFPEMSLPGDDTLPLIDTLIDIPALPLIRSRSAPPATSVLPVPELPAKESSPSPHYSTPEPSPIYVDEEAKDEEAANSMFMLGRQSGWKESLIRYGAVGDQESSGLTEHEIEPQEVSCGDYIGEIGEEAIHDFREVLEEMYEAEEEEATDQAFTFWEDQEEDPIEAC